MSEKYLSATLTCTPIRPVSGGLLCLGDFLTHVRSSWSGAVQGLAFATNGTWPVLGTDQDPSKDSQELSVAPVEGRSFDDKKVFELRLRVLVTHTDDPEDDTLLAHEFRWVNDVNAAELTLTTGKKRVASDNSESTSVCGWAHEVSYLKHASAGSSKKATGPDSSVPQSKQCTESTGSADITVVEFIQEEDKYGNTVVVDQLFTGKWN